MFTYLVFGATYAFAAAVQPGPLQTYLISQTIRNGWRHTLPAVLAPVLSDGPIVALVLLVLTRVPPHAVHVLRFAGGAFLLALAVAAYRSWRDGSHGTSEAPPPPSRSLASAIVVNLLNPNPYLGWSLVLGPLLLKGWREAPANGIALVVAFYVTLAGTLAAIVTLFAATKAMGPRVGRALVGISAVALAGFACYQLWSGATAFLAG